MNNLIITTAATFSIFIGGYSVGAFIAGRQVRRLLAVLRIRSDHVADLSTRVSSLQTQLDDFPVRGKGGKFASKVAK